MSDLDTATFVAQRDQLVSDIVQGLSESVNNLKTLNRNLQSLNQVGQGFERMGSVWIRFHERIKAEAKTDAL